jgi:hypothetical protein
MFVTQRLPLNPLTSKRIRVLRCSQPCRCGPDQVRGRTGIGVESEGLHILGHSFRADGAGVQVKCSNPVLAVLNVDDADEPAYRAFRECIS